MDADHEHICKFEKANGDDYDQVIGNLAMLVEQATKARPALQPDGSACM